MSDRPLLLGESPARDGDWRRPLSGRCAETLCKLMGIEMDPPNIAVAKLARFEHPAVDPYSEIVTRFRCLNAVERYEDARPWSAKRARDRMHRWFIKNDIPETIVCLGRRAAASTNMIPSGQPWGVWYEQPGVCSVVAIPHPSGLNRLYNDECWRAMAGATLRDACELSRSIQESLPA